MNFNLCGRPLFSLHGALDGLLVGLLCMAVLTVIGVAPVALFMPEMGAALFSLWWRIALTTAWIATIVGSVTPFFVPDKSP